jgi:hypothetical protein
MRQPFCSCTKRGKLHLGIKPNPWPFGQQWVKPSGQPTLLGVHIRLTAEPVEGTIAAASSGCHRTPPGITAG